MDKYIFYKIKYILFNRNMSILIDYFRSQGLLIGDNCMIYSNIVTSESFLLQIGNNVTVSNGVQFITHDNSICKVFPELTDTFGKIIIGNNCFIGSHAIILPGITIGNNTIIAAGSVVSKSFNGNCVIAGNPAKELCSIDVYKEKIKNKGFNIAGLSSLEIQKLILANPSKLLKK